MKTSDVDETSLSLGSTMTQVVTVGLRVDFHRFQVSSGGVELFE